VVHFAPLQAYFFLSECVEYVAASTQSVHLTETKLLGAEAAHPVQPQQLSEAILDRYVNASPKLP